jgi:dTDP-4-dehydrorhamnose reductase
MMPIERWGGAECTVNRVGDGYRDQLSATGHHERLDDLDLLATLNLQAVRFPVLWEHASAVSPSACDFSWCDLRLARLRELGIRPILGLVHHGSGPPHTSLLDNGFAAGLAEHAKATAERYPWVTDWTPVNEPLTTARFSALYGLWHPHARDERLMWLALLNQIDATRLSMREIRKVNPEARLIQTDDLGRTYATAAAADQAAFDNTRRWMGWDLLVGRVVPGHALWDRLCGMGFEDRLRTIADDPCPPDVIGLNHYLTSDRFLDHRLQRYPAETHGGNGEARFADVAAVRVLDPPPGGFRAALRDAWERYRLPVALTEVHVGCTREEQLRWICEAWEAAEEARAEGIDVRAVTAWALFGNHGWNTLLTADGIYEPGVYDTRGGSPRPTALAELIKRGTAARDHHPVLREAGWWRRDIRLHHPPVPRPARLREGLLGKIEGVDSTPPLLILGATGTLGRELAAASRHRGIRHVLTGRDQLDLGDERSIAAALDFHQPWAVINAAGFVRVDDAEQEADACLAANAAGAIALASACAKRGIPTVNFSSDLVFDGGKREPYVESDPVAPLNVYGRSKAEMEAGVLALDGNNLIIRTAAFFSPYDEANFAVHVLRALERGENPAAASDREVTPTYVPDLCNAVLDLLIDGGTGVWHLSNGEQMSWAEFGRAIAEACGYDPARVEALPADRLGWSAERPLASGLVSARGELLPRLGDALRRFAEHFPAPWTAPELRPDQRAAA